MRHSSSVKICKRYIVRTGDMFYMNGKFSKTLPTKTWLSCKASVGAGRLKKETLQKSVSIPAVVRYTALIERGSIAPPVKMDGNTIVDGNHRMVAGLLCNQIPASTPGTAPLSKPRIPLRDIQPDPIDWW